MSSISNSSLDEQLGLSISLIQKSHYKSLDIRNMKKNHWIISHVASGSLTLATGGEIYHVHPGQVMIHPPNVEFSEHNPAEGTHNVLFLDIKLYDHLDLLRVYPMGPLVTLSDESRYSYLFDQLQLVWEQPHTPFRNVHIFSSILELVKLLLLSWQEEGQTPRPESLDSTEDRFMRVIQYMNENLHRKISREELSELLHLHPNYFDKLFNRHFRQTPMHMLRSLRLRKAKALLETTSDSLEWIAELCGLGDAAYFTRSFKRRFGETPGQYRTRMQKLRRIYGSE